MRSIFFSLVLALVSGTFVTSVDAQANLDFTGRPLFGPSPLVVQFTNLGSGFPSLAWDFDGDGLVDSVVRNPSFTYLAKSLRSHTVTLVGYWPQGMAVVTKPNYITVGEALGIPAATGIRSSPNETLGFWFQAPRRMSIHGIHVPDPVAHGQQNVEVYRLPGPPPTGRISALGQPIFARHGVKSGQILRCSLSFEKGEYIGILGASGDAAMMNSSTSSSFTSTLWGFKIPLGGLRSPSNLAAAVTSRPYTALSGLMGRVTLYVSKAATLSYGQSSQSSNGSLAPSLDTRGWPIPSRTPELVLNNFDPAASVAMVVVGLDRAALPLPFGTVNVKRIIADFSIPATGTVIVGANVLPVPVPQMQSLVGLSINFQGMTYSPGSTQPIALTKGVEWLIRY